MAATGFGDARNPELAACTIHISHAFMAATGKNRNRRVVAAMDKVGVPILNGVITSILGILMLAFAKSDAFQSFFKKMLLVMVLGLFHSIMLLPVLPRAHAAE